MSNFRLNLPVDIPWKLIGCSLDMMDTTFCNNKSPKPFESSLAIYAFEPNAEELPEEMCGDQITYLKVSCTITGYQPTTEEKEQIVSLFDEAEVDYSKIEQIISEYFGCYGVLLNVSVHPDDEFKEDVFQYPHIVDFEPKTRDFYQSASETGEILTTSFGKVSTNKSFASTDTTQNSWQAGMKATAAVPGVPIGLEATGTTGQVRTETDQTNWATTTDASRERKENQSTTTQLSQMYNLLTGYHTGTNRAAFVMLPRPHILQPTDRRTFTQGLRMIEGIQDFFLVVIRPKGQKILKVDAHLQTGHFPENVEVVDTVSFEDQFEFKSKIVGPFTKKCLGLGLVEGVAGAVVDGLGGEPSFNKTAVTNGQEVFDGFEVDGWEFDTTKGKSGHKAIAEIELKGDNLADFDAISFGTHVFKAVVPDQVIIDIVVKNGNMAGIAFDDAARKAKFSREYEVFLRKKKNVEVGQAAAVPDLLITQRSLCLQMYFGDCIERVDLKNPFDVGIVVVAEPAIDFDDLYEIPIGTGLDVQKATGSIHPKGPRFDFAFKKGIVRKIQQALITAGNSPLRYELGQVGYLQTKHFRRRLLKVLPKHVLDSRVQELKWVNEEVRKAADTTLGEFLSISDHKSAVKLNVPLKDIRKLQTVLVGPRKTSVKEPSSGPNTSESTEG